MSTLGLAAYHLVRRGLDASFDEKPSDPDQPDQPFPVMGFTIVSATIVLLFIVSGCVCVSPAVIGPSTKKTSLI